MSTGLTGLVRAEWMLARYPGQVIPCNWQMTDYTQFIDTCAPMGFLVAEFRNLASQEFLDKGFQWLVFVDHDTIIPGNFLMTINERIIKDPIPMWSGLYFTKSVPSEPLVYRGKGSGYFADWKLGDKVWVDAFPMGCTVIHRSVIKAAWNVSEPYLVQGTPVRRVFESPRYAWADPISYQWKTRTGTEDLDFCWKFIEKGLFSKTDFPEYSRKKYPYMVDTSLFCWHITPDGKKFPSQGEEQYFMSNGNGRRRKSNHTKAGS